MQDARNGPRMVEDPVGPRHAIAGGPVDEGRGMGTGPGAGHGKGERDIAGWRMQRDRGNRTASTKQQTRGTEKPAAMVWGTVGQPWGTWPREVGKMP